MYSFISLAVPSPVYSPVYGIYVCTYVRTHARTHEYAYNILFLVCESHRPEPWLSPFVVRYFARTHTTVFFFSHLYYMCILTKQVAVTPHSFCSFFCCICPNLFFWQSPSVPRLGPAQLNSAQLPSFSWLNFRKLSSLLCCCCCSLGCKTRLIIPSSSSS